MLPPLAINCFRQDNSFSAAACGRSGFRKWATRVDHLIGCPIDDFAIRTREIASGCSRGHPHVFNVNLHHRGVAGAPAREFLGDVANSNCALKSLPALDREWAYRWGYAHSAEPVVAALLPVAADADPGRGFDKSAKICSTWADCRRFVMGQQLVCRNDYDSGGETVEGRAASAPAAGSCGATARRRSRLAKGRWKSERSTTRVIVCVSSSPRARREFGATRACDVEKQLADFPLPG